MKSFLSILFLALSINLYLFPQYRWEQTKGPYSGTVRGQVFDSGVFYFATDYGVFRSVDDCRTFQKFGLQQGYTINAIAVDDQFVYAGSYTDIYRINKIDDISGWQLLSFPGGIVQHIKVHPAGIIFAATNDIVLKSTNHGDSWTTVSGGLPSENLKSILITDSGHIFLGYKSAGIYKSTDHGREWEPKSGGLPIEGEPSLMEDHNGNIFAGFDQYSTGLYKSTDGGETWALNFSTHITFMHRGPGDKIYAGNNSILYRSTNNGTNWTTTGAGINKYYIGTSASQNNKGDLFIGTHSGLYRSNNSGHDFLLVGLPIERVSALAVSNDGEYFAGGEYYVSRSGNQGETWERQLGLTGVSVYSMLRTNHGSILVGYHYNGIFRMTEAGSWTWSLKKYNYVIDIVQGNSGIIYAVDPDTLYRSLDDGQTWIKVTSVSFNGDLNTAAEHEGKLYLGTLGAGVYVSADSGVNWDQLNDGLLNPNISHLLSDRTGKLYAATGMGIYQLNGEHWTDINTPATKIRINRLMVWNNKIYAATNNGIYISGVNDPEWIPNNEGLEDLIVLSIAVDSTGSPIAGTYKGSVYRWCEELVTGIKEEELNPGDFALYQNYPNPFNPVTKIKYRIGGKNIVKVSLRIYDLPGALVQTLVDEEKYPGTYETEFNGAPYPSGVYFFRFSAGAFSKTGKLVMIK